MEKEKDGESPWWKQVENLLTIEKNKRKVTRKEQEGDGKRANSEGVMIN